VISHLYVFGSGVEHWIFGNTYYGTGAITQERNVGSLLTEVTQVIGDPKKLGTTTNNNYILGLGGRVSYT
jgi:hypothetical protein